MIELSPVSGRYVYRLDYCADGKANIYISKGFKSYAEAETAEREHIIRISTKSNYNKLN